MMIVSMKYELAWWFDSNLAIAWSLFFFC